jgi:hypothetical protein
MDEDFLTIRAAIELVANTGWRAFPVGLDKKPIIKGWPQLASSDPAELTKMFGNNRISRVGIGIATGKASNLAVLDIDTGSEKDGRVWLNGPGQALALTASSNTPSGGAHFYFKYPCDRELRNSASLLAPGVDIRAEGGYVVAPPSRNTKGVYKWAVEPINGCDLVAPFPDWLSEKLAKRPVSVADRSSNSRFSAPGSVKAKPWPPSSRSTVGRELDTPVHEGSRNHEMTRRFGYLVRRFGPHWARQMAMAINYSVFHPPLSDQELEGIFMSIEQRGGGK